MQQEEWFKELVGNAQAQLKRLADLFSEICQRPDSVNRTKLLDDIAHAQNQIFELLTLASCEIAKGMAESQQTKR